MMLQSSGTDRVHLRPPGSPPVLLVAATDEASLEVAAEQAIPLARALRAEVTLLLALDRKSLLSFDDLTYLREAVMREMVDEGAVALAKAFLRCEEDGIRSETLLRFGPLENVLADLVREGLTPDTIVLPVETGPVWRRLFGDGAGLVRRVLERVSCPVVVVPRGPRATKGTVTEWIGNLLFQGRTRGRTGARAG